MTWMIRHLAVVVCAVSIAAAQIDGDDFDDGVVDTSRWGADIVDGNAALSEVNQRLELTVSAPTAKDQVVRPWAFAVGPYDASWELRLDVYDDTSPAENDEVSSVGIDVLSTRDTDDEFFAEIYASHLFNPPLRRGFHAELLNDGATVGPGSDSTGIGVTSGAVRIAFDAATKVLTAYYDVDPANGYTWVQLASYGVAGAGGADGNADFGMTDANRFLVSVYAFSASMTVSSGQMWADDFVTTGLVPIPHPTTTTSTTSTTSTTTSTTTSPSTTTTTLAPRCPVTPESGCRRPATGKGALTIKDKAGGAKDALVWKWPKGAATTAAELGDPRATSEYRLCVWDASGLRLDAVARAAGTCGGKPCWKAVKRGYRFRDKTRSPDGILRLVLTAGTDGKAKIVLAAKGENLEPPPPPLGVPVTVQLARSDGGPCWESTFAAARKNAAGRFAASSE